MSVQQGPRAPDEADDLESSIRSWLDDNGYPLEMRTASVLHSVGFAVSQSDYFESADGKKREIDVWASRTYKLVREPKHSLAVVDFHLVAECKASPIAHRPVVIFTSAAGEAVRHSLVEDRPGTASMRGLLVALSDEPDVLALDAFRKRHRLGYGIEEGPSELDPKKDHNKAQERPEGGRIFRAIQKLVDITTFVVQECGSAPGLARLVFPTLIVSEPIFECYLDDDDKIRLVRVDRSTLAWKVPVAGTVNTFIEVVNIRALEDYASALREAQELLCTNHRDIVVSMADES